MKNRLEFLAIFLMVLFFAFPVKAFGDGEETPNLDGSTLNLPDPDKAQTNEGPFTDVTYDTGTRVNGIYKSGTHSIDSKVEQDDLKKVQEVTALGGQIANAGSGVTKDPKTASYVAAGGSMLGATGALFGAAHYYSQIDKYKDAAAINEIAVQHNETEIEKIDAEIERFKEGDGQNSPQQKEGIAGLQTKKAEIGKELAAQKALASKYSAATWGSRIGAGMALVSSAAMGWTASMQLKQGKELAADQDYCAKHPNEFPRCTEVVPQGDNTRLPDPNQNSSVSLTDPGFNGQNDAGDEDFSPALASPVGGNGGAAGAGPSLGGAGFGNGSSAEGRKPAEEKKDLDDIGGSGFSGDQSYDLAGGNLDQLGSGSAASSVTAPSLSGFDISQFLPSNLKEEELGGFKAARINDKESKEEGLVLSKESPSLFTRISKAHQKKAPEMIDMMKEVI